MKIQIIKVLITLVASILLLLTVLIVFKICKFPVKGYLTFIILKTSFRKTVPKEIRYRDYSKFNADDWKTELKQNLAPSSSVIW